MRKIEAEIFIKDVSESDAKYYVKYYNKHRPYKELIKKNPAYYTALQTGKKSLTHGSWSRLWNVYKERVVSE